MATRWCCSRTTMGESETIELAGADTVLTLSRTSFVARHKTRRCHTEVVCAERGAVFVDIYSNLFNTNIKY